MKNIRVLIAEDQLILRDNLKYMLEKESDIEVCGVAQSGGEAIKLAFQTNPEIILMDVEMETSYAGIEAAKTILSNNEDIKIIFLTVHEDDKTVIEALNTGAVDYLIKTADCKNTITHIRQAHNDIIKMEAAIQKILHTEYLKLAHTTQDNLAFIKQLMLLTTTERQIIILLLHGLKIREIADKRFVETVTIKKQIGTILKKCNIKRTKQLCERIKELQISSLFE